ncbi:MAG: linked oxidase, partial [Segetibacter sp.]|nr:linked oxidase [Segetibacter sp.]
GDALSPSIDGEDGGQLKNWAGNYEYSTNRLFPATSTEQVRELVKKHNKIKVLGSRHCFNSIADSADNFISVKQMDDVISLDEKARTITVEAGVAYGKLAPYLHSRGFALHNLASLPHISIAGACATATHGSGVKNGNLATAVTAMEIVTAAGDVQVISKEHDAEKFDGAVVNLGGIGVVTKVTLKIVPTFMMRQNVYENLALKQLEEHLDEVLSAGYSVSLFTDWKNQNFSQVWIKRKVDDGAAFKAEPTFFGATLAQKNLHPIGTMSPINCTDQMGVPAEWYERMPHFKMGYTPSSGKELQSEYFVPYESGYQALLAINELRTYIAPQLQISEIRTINADNFWMSPCYKQPSMAIHFTWKQNWPAVRKILPLIEEKLAPFNGRPHWGKLFTVSPSRLKLLYEKLPDFQQLMHEYDPHGKFRNKFLDTNIFSS